jgi:hypothetical protein
MAIPEERKKEVEQTLYGDKSLEVLHYNVTYVLIVIHISTPRKLEVVKVDFYVVGISHTVINIWLRVRFTAVCIRVLQFLVLFLLKTESYSSSHHLLHILNCCLQPRQQQQHYHSSITIVSIIRYFS